MVRAGFSILPRRQTIKATQRLHDLGQSIWLENLTRGLLATGTLREYIEEFSVTGLTSNPTIFDHAVRNGHDYDDAIRQKVKEGKSSEALFLELAIEDLRQAADLFRPTHIRTDGVDGLASLEVSPLLARNSEGTLAAAKALHARVGRPNLFIKIPGTSAGLHAVEEAIFGGVPINADAVLAEFADADIDTDVLATKLLGEGIESFGKSWRDLLACVKSESEELKAA